MLVNSQKYHFDLDAVRVPHRIRAAGYDLGKNPGDVWKIPTQPHKDAHFAIFPDKLVEPLIKVGCPLKVCPECGFISEKIFEIESGNGEGKTYDGNRPDNMVFSGRNRQSSHKFMGYTYCDCVAGWNPGTVLDPFAGSGTTMKIAKELGRNVIGIELNSDYCKIIKRNLMFHQYTLGNIVNKFTELK